ncbi:hypothetical protein ACQCQ3_24695, partial [Ralstonia pseudosolanacearum]
RCSGDRYFTSLSSATCRVREVAYSAMGGRTGGIVGAAAGGGAGAALGGHIQRSSNAEPEGDDRGYRKHGKHHHRH